MQKYINPKQLNVGAVVDAIENDANLVTIGFKCPPQLKLRLIQDAEEEELTLSAYVNQLITHTDKIKNDNINLFSNLERVNKNLAFYESRLSKILRIYKGDIIDYENTKGETIPQLVNCEKDIFSILINSCYY